MTSERSVCSTCELCRCIARNARAARTTRAAGLRARGRGARELLEELGARLVGRGARGLPAQLTHDVRERGVALELVLDRALGEEVLHAGEVLERLGLGTARLVHRAARPAAVAAGGLGHFSIANACTPQ